MTSLTDWIARLYDNPDMLLLGHAQRKEDLNLGLGFIYYGLARATRPMTAVVIGSMRGFVPAVIARALADNKEGGQVHFIDPSLVDGFWREPGRVRAHFAALGLANITHHLQTTQQFAASSAYAALPEVGLLFVDGYHSEEQATYDLHAFLPKLSSAAHVLFHDSIRIRTSGIYGEDKRYEHGVKRLIDKLKADPAWQTLDFILADGLTIARRVTEVPPPVLSPLPTTKY